MDLPCVPTSTLGIDCAECELRPAAAFRPFAAGELAFVSSMKVAHITRPARVELLTSTAAPSLYTLYEGWAIRYRMLDDGKRQITEVLLPGDLLGIQSKLLGPDAEKVCSLTPVSLCVLEGRPLSDLLSTQPELSMALFTLLSEKQRRAEAHLASLGRRDAVPRLAYFILDIFDRLRLRGMANCAWCPFPLQRQHLADALGLSGTHVKRSLDQLAAQGIAFLDGKAMALRDHDTLAELAGYPDEDAQPTKRWALI